MQAIRVKTISSRLPTVFVCLFFALLFIVGVATLRDYSAPFDEPWEMNTLCENLKEYALKLEGEGGTSFFATLACARISESTERDHGICAYYPLAPWLPMLSRDMHLFSYAWSMLTWCWFMLGCASLYGFMREMKAPRALACGASLLLYLMPRFFAEGHYNNKDIVLLSLVLCCLWMGARLLGKPTFLRALLFSLAGAMATNIKVAGALPWGLMGLAVVTALTLRRGWSRRMAWVATVATLSYIGFYMLLTPAAWSAPISYLRYLMDNATRFTRNAGNVIFRGADFYDILNETPLPRYYVPYYILVTVPLYTLLLAALGQLGAFRMWLKGNDECRQADKAGTDEIETSALAGHDRLNEKLLLAAATLMWLLPIAGAVLLRPVIYNGWRHFYFAFSGIAILAGYGMLCVWRWARGRRFLRRACALALAACLCLSGVGIAFNHPFEFAYFNPLQPRDSQYTMDMDYWHAGAAGAFKRLYELKKDEAGEIRVGCYFNDISIGEYKLPEEIERRITVTTERDEEYLYYNSTYAHNFWVKEPPEGYHELFRCRSYGNTFAVMYERDEK